MEVYPTGDVYWSQRIRMTVNCRMHLERLPYDEQLCSLQMGPYSQSEAEVVLRWTQRNDGLALSNLDGQQNAEWEIGTQEQDSLSEVYSSGNYSVATVSFMLTRNPAQYEREMIQALIFVFIQYLGVWIDPAAAPGRIALGVLMVLIVMNQREAVKSGLPKGAGRVWLLDLLFGCFVLNIACFFTYVLVNFGMQANSQLQALEKADKEQKQKAGEEKREESTVGTSKKGTHSLPPGVYRVPLDSNGSGFVVNGEVGSRPRGASWSPPIWRSIFGCLSCRLNENMCLLLCALPPDACSAPVCVSRVGAVDRLGIWARESEHSRQASRRHEGPYGHGRHA
jgi:hypothetical protein